MKVWKNISNSGNQELGPLRFIILFCRQLFEIFQNERVLRNDPVVERKQG